MSEVSQCLGSRNYLKIIRSNDKIVTLLLALGVPRSMLFSRIRNGQWVRGKHGDATHFWRLSSEKMWNVLEEAELCYFRAIKHLHPDKATGDLKKAQRLNVVWGTIKKRFKEHGYELQ